MIYDLLGQECLACGDTIVNPICFRCVEQEIKKWLVGKHLPYLVRLQRASDFFRSYHHQGGDCIICGQNLNVCSSCYCMTVHKSFASNKRLAEEFTTFADSKGFVSAIELFNEKR